MSSRVLALEEKSIPEALWGLGRLGRWLQGPWAGTQARGGRPGAPASHSEGRAPFSSCSFSFAH